MDTNVIKLIPRCFSCHDVGFDVSKEGIISTCWRAKAGAEHNEANEASKMIARAIHQLMIEKVAVEPHVFAVARTLTQYTTAAPCKGSRLEDLHFSHVKDSRRECSATMETLRKVWLLPVGSRRESPAGYWIISDLDDFAAWVIKAKAGPITSLTTIHRVAKRNFPHFAEQLELDFWRDMHPQNATALAA